MRGGPIGDILYMTILKEEGFLEPILYISAREGEYPMTRPYIDELAKSVEALLTTEVCCYVKITQWALDEGGSY